METIGLRELRQNASQLVRRAEAGEEVLITVSGRQVARLVRANTHEWRSFEATKELFDGPDDPEWNADRDVIDQEIKDPWTAE